MENSNQQLSSANLSANDKDVLNRIFDQDMFKDSAQIDHKSEQPYSIEVMKRIGELNLEAIQETENGNVDEALIKFSQILEQYPLHAQSWNNRSQAYLVKKDLEHALNDVSQAISLGSYDSEFLSQAYCQRAMIRTLIENKQSRQSEACNDDLSSFSFISELSEESRRDFEAAAKLGNQFAKNELVRTNPYAKMCNAMLKDMTKLYKIDR
ncbi:hypothetical protein MIR68_002533 [Amoeboaphelidium protococcarum]|nr:hypothetical protein MIR68_002533 [Amoeboaphelidium protococcarum]